MRVIPAINEPDFEKVKARIFTARDFGAMRIHIDVTDGKFTQHKTWSDVKDLIELRFITNNFEFNIGIHLMVENPDEIIDTWFKAGMHAVVVPFETAKNLGVIMEKCRRNKTEFVLGVNPSTAVESLGDLKKFENIQLLAVDPGAAGQEFQEITIDKIKKLRGMGFNGKIIIDGGINPDTARLVKAAGADAVISASYIWNNKNPKKAYVELKTI